MTADDEYVTVRKAALALGVHENTIRRWTDEGVIKDYRKLPGSGFRRIAWSEVKRLEEEMDE